MGFLRKILEALHLKEKKCEMHCKICKIKGCCGNCVHGEFYQENVGSYGSFIYELRVACDFKFVDRNKAFPRNTPIFMNCDKWRPRYPKNFK